MKQRTLYSAKARGYSFIRSLNPAAWFRAGVGQTVTGSGVSTWADQSGNGRDLLQGTDAARPALQADGSVLFNGTSHYLKCNAFTLNQPETVYLAFKQVSWTSVDRIFDANTASDGTLRQASVSPKIDILSPTGNAALLNSDLSVGAYGVVAAVFNGASSILQVNNNAALTGDVGSNNMGGFTLGSASSGGSNWANIQVLEVIIFSTAHDATQRARIISYLAGRHGVVL